MFTFTDYYKPVQRVSEACQECRKKKARCTGERPQCGSCRRLARECVYPSRRRPEQAAVLGQQDTRTLISDIHNISARLENIEQFLRIQTDQTDARVDSTRHGAAERLSSRADSSEPAFFLRSTSIDKRRSFESAADESGCRLPTEAVPWDVVLKLVDLYFVHCHMQPYCFFSEADFRRSLADQEIPSHLLFAVMASSVPYSKNTFFENPYATAKTFAVRSWDSLIPSHVTHAGAGDLRCVQTITILAAFDLSAGSDHYKSAWLRIGLAVRLAQDLRLMTETTTHLPTSEQKEQCLSFWSIYHLDRLVSCGRSRPPAILDASCRLCLPSDDTTSEFMAPQNTLTLGDFIHRTSTRPDQWSPLAKLTVASYTLSRAAQGMLQNLNLRSNRPPWDSDSDFAWILSDLLYLENILDISTPLDGLIQGCTLATGHIDQHRAAPLLFSRLLFHLTYCLLHHPFLLRKRMASGAGMPPDSFLKRAFVMARDHSMSLLNLLNELLRLNLSSQTSFYGYCAVVAGTIIALSPSENGWAQVIAGTDVSRPSHLALQSLDQWKCSNSVKTAFKSFYNDRSNYGLLLQVPLVADHQIPGNLEKIWLLLDYDFFASKDITSQDSTTDDEVVVDMDESGLDAFGDSTLPGFPIQDTLSPAQYDRGDDEDASHFLWDISDS